MKRFLSLVIVMVGLLVLAGCKPTAVTGHIYDFSQQQKKTTTIKVWLDDQDKKWANELITEFNKIHPGIIVEFAHMSTVDAESNLQLYGPSGNGADIFQFPHDHIASALQNDLLASLPSDYVDDLTARMNPTAMGIASVCYNESTKSFECTTNSQEQLFGAPLSLESVALFYNKDIVTTPETIFDGLIQYSQDYTTAHPGKYGFLTNYNDSYFMNFAYTAFGFSPFGPNENNKDTPMINSQPVIDGLTWVKDNLKPLYAAGSTAAGIQGLGGQFESGNLPYIITGPWMIETYDNDNLNYGVTTIPTIDVNGTAVHPETYAGAQMIGLYKYSKHPEAALEFMKFMTSDQGLNIMYKNKGKLPALNTEHLANITGLAQDEHLQGIADQLQY